MVQVPDLIKECTFHAIRSGGKGGQNVNKVATKVELYFSISESNLLSSEQKDLLSKKLAHLINADGNIRMTSEEARTQRENKLIVYDKFMALIVKALTPVKKRVPTKKTKAANEKRLNVKSKLSEKKSSRRKPDAD